MKKYQLWLERKTYSQHLNNLVRIKLESSQRKLASKLSLQQERSSLAPRILSPNKENSLFMSPRDLSYIITSRQLQKHKMRLVRSNEIVRENEQIVKRLNQAKPFISNTRPIDYSNYKLKRRMQRANEEHNDQLKDKNYRQFVKHQNQKVKQSDKYQLTITLQEIEHRISVHHTAQVRLEILAPTSVAKSELVSPSQLIGHSFQFTFNETIPDCFVVRVHCYKNLQHSIIGDYSVKRPEQGTTQQGQWPSRLLQGHIVTRMTFTKLLPKFWSVRRFNV